MKVYPAIDLLGGKAVRLAQGRREDAKVYSDDPVSLVAGFAKAGAQRIHVVDLDAAFSGQIVHRELIEAMAKSTSVPIQLGGGIRDEEALESAFSMGVAFAIIGTAAIKNRKFVRRACHRFAERVIIAVDADAEGNVAVEGWAEESGVSALELATRVSVWGACGLLYTDITRDGTAMGPNVQATAALARAVDIPVTACGGVSSLADLHELALGDIDSVVVGSALYEGLFTLEDAIAAVGELGGG